jgi:hypothetical protein
MDPDRSLSERSTVLVSLIVIQLALGNWNHDVHACANAFSVAL